MPIDRATLLPEQVRGSAERGDDAISVVRDKTRCINACQKFKAWPPEASQVHGVGASRFLVDAYYARKTTDKGTRPVASASATWLRAGNWRKAVEEAAVYDNLRGSGHESPAHGAEWPPHQPTNQPKHWSVPPDRMVKLIAVSRSVLSPCHAVWL